MIARLSSAALGAVLLASPFALGLSPSEIPPDTPIASLVSSAKSHLAQGNANDALTYFDVAIQRDPGNYLTIFQRGATYLSLGKNAQAGRDFDKVLTIRPNFEGALLQRAKIRSKNADWKSAREDFEAAGKAAGPEIAQLEEAQGAAFLAAQSEKSGDWEGCISHAATAIMVASTSLSLRQIRARCRFERGEVLEGVSDLAHAVQISPGSTEPYLQMSSMLFYSVGDMEKGMEQIRKCLHSDPDSRACSKLYRQEKQADKAMKQISALKDKRQLNSAVKLLVGVGEETGLIQDVKEAVSSGKESGYIHQNSPDELYASLVELTCELYSDVIPDRPLNQDQPTNLFTDDQQKESPTLLHRGPNPQTSLSSRTALPSPASIRRRGIRSMYPDPQQRKGAPSFSGANRPTLPTGSGAPETIQDQRLLQSTKCS